MSIIGDLPVSSLKELFQAFGVRVEVTERGVRFTHANGKSYRIDPFEGFARGSAVSRACRVFAIDPFELVAQLPLPQIAASTDS